MSDVLPRHISVYRPSRISGAGPARPDRCAASVRRQVGHWWNSYQCEKAPKFEHAGHRYCGLHHPPKVAEREERRYADRMAEATAKRHRWDRERAEVKQKDAALEAIKQIAAGHNDPRALAFAVLAAKPDTEIAGAEQGFVGHPTKEPSSSSNKPNSER